MKNKSVLVIFAKYPETGKVKTRLGKSIGYENSMLVYKTMLKDTILKFSIRINYDMALCYTPKDKKNYFKFMEGTIYPQNNGNLGYRMMDCFRHFLKKYVNVIIIGSDAPMINPKIVKNSFKLLKGKDIVLGKSDDGGYYLVGMKKVHDIFLGINWGTENVLKATIKKIKKMDLSYKLLPELADVDTVEDLRKIRKQIKKNNSPNTFEILKRIKI